MKTWEIALLTIFAIIALGALALCAWLTQWALSATYQRIKVARMQPGTAQVVSFTVSRHDPENSSYSDERPVVTLELDCELKGKHFLFNLEPLTSQRLFKALGLPPNSPSCWMTDEQWQQLLQGRRVSIACDSKSEKAVLIGKLHYSRMQIVSWLIAVMILIAIVLLAFLTTKQL